MNLLKVVRKTKEANLENLIVDHGKPTLETIKTIIKDSIKMRNCTIYIGHKIHIVLQLMCSLVYHQDAMNVTTN